MFHRLRDKPSMIETQIFHNFTNKKNITNLIKEISKGNHTDTHINDLIPPEIKNPITYPTIEFVSPSYESYRYIIHGKYHRDTKLGPAMIKFNSMNYHTKGIYYYVDDEIHRDQNEGPAVIEWSNDGYVEKYYKEGLEHRINFPAVLSYRFDYSISEYTPLLVYQCHYENGKVHNLNGRSINMW